MSSEDFLPLRGYDHIEFYVGNAKQSAHFYDNVFGFKCVAKRGLKTGCRDSASYVMQQGKIRIVLTCTLGPDHEIARHCALHGDSVKRIALEVGDCESAMREAQAREATVIKSCEVLEDEDGIMKVGEFAYAGDTTIKFVERMNYRGVFAPGFEPVHAEGAPSTGLLAIDHIVTNVYLGEMNFWVDWFKRVLGFRQLAHFTNDDISTEYSALMSKVVENGTGKCKFPINEPAEGKRKSQIDEYLDFNRGQGVQHIALNSNDICQTVRMLKKRNIDFLRVPDSYYEDLRERVGDIDEDFDELKKLGILVDRDEDGYLLQVFTSPIQDRPTVFYEVIERHGSRGFGVGNFKALFVSLEREQESRGNL